MDTSNLHTVPEVFLAAFKTYRDRPAFTCLGQTLTYGDIDQYSAQFASYLQHHTSLKPGDRVAVQLANILQYPVALYGILRAGMTLVNTNPLYTEREVEHQLNDSGAKALVVMANVASTAAAVIRNTSVEQVIVTEAADLHGFPKRPIINFVAKHIKKMVPPFSFPNQVSFRKALSLGAVVAPTDMMAKPEDVAVLQYTGGTTGVAKGAMLTHHNLVSNMKQMDDRLGERVQPGQEVFIAPLPLYHIYAFTLHCMMMTSTGNHSILIPNPRDLDSLVAAIKPYQLTGFVGLNTLFNGLCHHEGFRNLDFSKLKTTASGGMALTTDVGNLWEKTTGCVAAEGYGMTETSPVISTSPADDIRAGTVGMPVKDTEVKVVDEEGNALPNGEPGELLVRGPQVMKGYWQRPEATAEVLSEDGWLNTGDMAVIDDDGYIKIVDRKKDMIIVSGFNVYPNEIEDEVCKHPGVLEAAAIGVEDAKTGEAVKLFVVKSDAALTREDVVAFCRKQMTAYKIPRQIEFREELPKSNVGKILRRELKAEEEAKAGSKAA
ncbi:AMP-binding protein [Pseudomaricurvus alkylphenolicus]|jgi:long-chain acyl-CoA synthetase|uniref:AMP-binding protein n=1 Tax=Pseudomaricurvus alkylphenolicus TaxID=1306991 RepID=UPI00141E5B29|nr:AMP-binding protein [Pseudomaricurvus alkylphenolicus]NIB43713.1 AMP-binding protein [Pseudomaricurvus alkylphenolicus]